MHGRSELVLMHFGMYTKYTKECIVALHWPQSVSHEYLRILFP